MTVTFAAIIIFALLIAILATSFWIGLALVATGAVSISLFANPQAGKVVATTIWGNAASWTMTALPMFLLMGEILFRSRLSDGMFNGLAPWLSRIPGRLMHTTTVGCAMFGAVSGSSTATAATISQIVLPELKRRGYPEKIVIGSLAASGTLGILIPPSIIMVVYAVAAEVSILQLFIAGIVPGLLLAMLFSAYIMVWSILNPASVPVPAEHASFAQKLRASRHLLPIIALTVSVFWGMFSGIATATEVGALGVVGALIIAAVNRTLTWKVFWESAAGALRVTCMIGLLIAGANVFSAAMAFTGIPASLAEWVKEMHFHRYTLIAALILIYVLLGMVLEGVSMILLTTSIALPMVVAAGFDPIWFGVFIVIMTELAALSPPVGFNLSVLQVMTRRDIGYVALASLPFFLILTLSVALFAIFPEIVTFLPKWVMSR